MTTFVSTQRATGAVVAGQFVLAGDDYPNTTDIMLLPFDSVPAATGVKRFKNVGWYVAGGVFEEWITTDTPGTVPPSGHTLINVQHYPI